MMDRRKSSMASVARKGAEYYVVIWPPALIASGPNTPRQELDELEEPRSAEH